MCYISGPQIDRNGVQYMLKGALFFYMSSGQNYLYSQIPFDMNYRFWWGPYRSPMFLQTAVSIAYRHIEKNTKYNSQPQIRALEAYSAFCTGMAQHLIYALGFLWHWAVQGSQHISGDLAARPMNKH